MYNLKRILFNTDVISQNRLAWVDYAKGIAIILVAYRHVLVGFDRAGLEIHPYLMNINEIFYSFRMPLFFILSGVFISQSLKKRSVKDLIRTKWKILLYPYLVWAIIQITLQIIFEKYTNAHRSLIDYSYILIQPDRIDQLWYLFALFNVSVLYLLTKTTLRLNNIQQLILGLIFYYLSTILNSGPQHDILYYYIYYAIGDAISARALNKKLYHYYGSPYLFLALLPLFISSQWYFINHLGIEYSHIIEFALVALIGCLFMINICFILAKYNLIKGLRIIGYHSLYIYVMHVIIASAARTFFVNVIGITNVPLLLIMNISLSMILSIILYNLAMRYKLWFLFSLNKKEEPSAKASILLPRGRDHANVGKKFVSSKPYHFR